MKICYQLKSYMLVIQFSVSVNLTNQCSTSSAQLPVGINMSAICNWTILTQRFDASLSFNRNWADYKNGFSDGSGANGNFWIGLENMHRLTTSTNCRLRFLLLALDDGNWYIADYDSIVIDSESGKYRWHFGNYSGNAGDSLRFGDTHILQDQLFSTCDVDSDTHAWTNCACTYESGWWFDNCYMASVTGVYGTIDYIWADPNQPVGFDRYGQLRASFMMIQKK